MNQTRRLTGKYQTPFGIAVWGFTAPGEAQEILVDDDGRLQVVTAAGSLSDVNIIEVLGAALTSANPVLAGIFDAAGNRMPSMDDAARPGYVDIIDVAARLVGIVYGEADQLQQLTPVDTMAPNLCLEAISFLSVYDAVADDWNRAREGANIGSLLTDPADRAARLLGVIYGENVQLQQLTPADAAAPNESLEVTSFNMIYDSVTGDWNRLREGAAIGQALVDPADRWARELGLIDVSRVLGAALTAANPLITGVFDAAGNRMPAMDAVARPGFVDMIDRAARLVGVISGTVDITELPAAAALSDTFANPTTTQMGAFLMGWEDGASQWERIAIDTSGRLECVTV